MSTEVRAQRVELVRQQIDCTCEAHYSNGETAFCQRWRQKTAEKIVDALATADDASHAHLTTMSSTLCLTCGLDSIDFNSDPYGFNS